MQYMANLMVRFKLLKTANIEGLIEDRFAREASLESISDVASILGGSE